VKYLNRRFTVPAGSPSISDEDWAAAFRRTPDPPPEPECTETETVPEPPAPSAPSP